MSKNIVISGYYGFDNLGDEAVLQSIIKALRDQNSNIEITVLSNDPERTAKKYEVQARNRWQLLEVFRALKKADLLISGGGSLLQDVTSQMSIPYYLGVVALARMLRVPVAFYAQGVGPIVGQLGRTLTRLIANRVQLITVRDQESLKFLQQIKVRRPELKVTVDPVVLLNSRNPKTVEYQQFLDLNQRTLSEDKPLIGVAPRPWKKLKNYQDVLCKTIERVQKDLGAEIVMLPMHQQMDLPFCREIANQIPKVRIIEGEYQPDEYLAFFQQLDLLVGIRLHALIFGVVAEVPVIGISYDPKIDSFLKRIDQNPLATVENLTTGLLSSEIVTKLSNRVAERQRIGQQLQKLRRAAGENAQDVLALLN